MSEFGDVKIERWYVHKYVNGTKYSASENRMVAKCVEEIAGAGPVFYTVPLNPGDCIVTELATGQRSVLTRDEAMGLPA